MIFFCDICIFVRGNKYLNPPTLRKRKNTIFPSKNMALSKNLKMSIKEECENCSTESDGSNINQSIS